jgi:hypothetical protein
LFVDGRLPSFQKNSHQNFFIKGILSLVLYKIDFLVLKFESPILKPKLNLLNFFFWEFFNTCINHLAQSFLINMTLKRHYINMFYKIDNLFGLPTWFFACFTMIAPKPIFFIFLNGLILLHCKWILVSS